MFAIEVSLLTGRYVATAYNDRRASEWPPHPARLFSALTATCLSGETVDPIEREALEWLEALPAPEIAASEAAVRDVVTVFVPVNDAHQTGDVEDEVQALDNARKALEAADTPKAQAAALKKVEKAEKKLAESMARAVAAPARPPSTSVARNGERVLPEFRVRQPRTFPSVSPVEPVVTFIWKGGHPAEDHRRALDRLLARVVRIGHSSSLVSARLVDSAPAATWFPSPAGKTVLRTTRAGQLGALIEAHSRHHETEPRVMPAGFTTYTNVREPVRKPAPSTCFEPDGLVLQRVGGPRLPMTAVAGLAGTVRRLLLSTAAEPIPEVISGHRPDGSASARDHLAIVPLPFVGSSHATGHLLGVALLLPNESGPEDRRALYLAIDAWERTARAPGDDEDAPAVPIHLGRLGSWVVRRLEDQDRQATLTLETWTRPSRIWHSATPVALDRHPGDLRSSNGRKSATAVAKAERSIEAAVQRVGLPRPLRVLVEPKPVLAGSVPARAFGRFPEDLEKNPRVLTHAVLEFSEPVQGPILIGAGRYMGLGLFRPGPFPEEC